MWRGHTVAFARVLRLSALDSDRLSDPFLGNVSSGDNPMGPLLCEGRSRLHFDCFWHGVPPGYRLDFEVFVIYLAIRTLGSYDAGARTANGREDNRIRWAGAAVRL